MRCAPSKKASSARRSPAVSCPSASASRARCFINAQRYQIARLLSGWSEIFEFVQIEDQFRLRLPTMGREVTGRPSEADQLRAADASVSAERLGHERHYRYTGCGSAGPGSIVGRWGPLSARCVDGGDLEWCGTLCQSANLV